MSENPPAIPQKGAGRKQKQAGSLEQEASATSGVSVLSHLPIDTTRIPANVPDQRNQGYQRSPIRMLNRSNTLHGEEGLLRRGLSIRQDDPLLPYSTEAYPDKMGSPCISDEEAIYITAATSVAAATLPRMSPLHPSASIRTPKNANFDPNDKRMALSAPNQFRAFSRRALSFQKRQWFTNLCCIGFHLVNQVCVLYLLFLLHLAFAQSFLRLLARAFRRITVFAF